jgi:site-specific DNA recombinase
LVVRRFATSTLVPDAAEAAVVRLVFGLHTRDTLGAKTIAHTLNDRGHRTTTGGQWSAHQVLRVLSNRVYLGELTFRGITAARCHPAIIEQAMFAGAQRILAARGEDHAKRAANGSDYLPTGLMRCPSCGKAMIGTRAHGRSRVYRYYTCFARVRYDSARCDASRLDADAVEEAVIAALASFYQHQHHLIADAIAQQQASHAASADGRRAELAAVEHELARTRAATDRYLTAFENGSLDPADLAPRLAHLKARTAQLHARHDELSAQIAAAPTAPPVATLLKIAGHIDDIVRSGTENQRKALIETLVARIKITGPDRIVPVFRMPDPAHPNQDSRPQPPDERNSQARDAVRAMTNLVGLMDHNPNRRPWLPVAGTEIPIRPVRAREIP